ncbi:helix-turn-helix transcriptional regulator [Geomicrobium sp. JCM 19039]|uniref:helix-turn-helix domain-containing protein n=1 Tax=Geomicrobium sp. JCM 19039 TaxID=1460636 RepID=UPI00045F43B3|nr:helix-turn-helix transcriptional regulator [Geomicrobium sp. JCM 19039]GAK11697.1 transcriptional regulator, XRE family [Geomicrobium sp. JCM 19039]
MKLHEHIRRLRMEHGLSQEQLALKLHVTRQAVYKWENEKAYPDIERLVELSRIFDVTIDELVKGDAQFRERIKVRNPLLKNTSFLSSLPYFSITILPVIGPVVAMAVGEEEIKRHGKRALLPQVIFLVLIVVFAVFILTGPLFSFSDSMFMTIALICFSLLFVYTVSAIVWSWLQGIAVLRVRD